MSFTEIKRREIKNYILRKIDEDDREVVGKTADSFGISATSVKRYFDAELSEGHIVSNADKQCGYELKTKVKKHSYDLNAITEREDGVLYDDIIPLLDVNENAGQIWRYALAEIFNNAIEHSEGSCVDVRLSANYLYSMITVTDNGIGIFRKIMNAMKSYGYRDPRIEDAVTELYKGKFTSCPERHTGEGIFFSMRLLDKFAVISDGIVLRKGYEGESSFVRSHLLNYAMKLTKKGTVVTMQLENDTRRGPAEVFDEYSNVDDGIIKTRIPVFEACLDRDPVARSQARRLCARLNFFREVVLDFDKVEIMGQGFADELFRVYQNAHPEVTLTCAGMNATVQKMYLHARNTKVVTPDYSDM